MELIHELTRKQAGSFHFPDQSVADREAAHWFGKQTFKYYQGGFIMAFFTSAVGVLQTLVIALGAGLAIWGVVNLMEGYGNDNPGAKSQGMKQFMAN
jgi:hypothetical protein